MKKICIVTATRAEYGLLRNVIREVQQDDELELVLVVTGTHLSNEYGNTICEIEFDNFLIAEKIDILETDTTEFDICKIMGNASIRFGEMFQRQKPDFLIVEGDRYELLPICSCAMVFGIPIAHISGGEVTEGVIDDSIRHCITKLSYLHFPACEEYRRRIIQLGEAPERVFNYGDVGVENIRKMNFILKKDLEEDLGISLSSIYACVTFHPVTLEKDLVIQQVGELIYVMERNKDINFIVTMANADSQGNKINELFEKSAEQNSNIFCFKSLGSKRYLSLMKYSSFVIGNSSSGIVEAPCFGIPTVNIGDRQKGRLRAESIIDCYPEREDIQKCINKVMSTEFKEYARNAINPYGNGNTAADIVSTVKEFLLDNKVNLKKKFYDI